MKQVHAFLRRRRAIPVICYLVAFLVWLLLGVGAAVSDAMARASGRLEELTLHAADFALVDLTLTASDAESETLVTTTGDPQMILEDLSGYTVRTMRVWASYEGDAREMCLYYTTRPGEPYSQDNRVYPAQQDEGSYLYVLPRTQIVSLRLDPCSPDEGRTVTMHLSRIALNTDVGGYFIPSWYQIFCLILYPGLAAALLDWLRAIALLALAYKAPSGKTASAD